MEYVLATSRAWYQPMAARLAARCGAPFTLITDPKDLTRSRLEELDPDYVFFPHWSYIIPPDIYQHFECVIFHMTDVPFGRGGSPLQNLIARGITETKISALRCTADIDAGPVYMKRPLCLYGTAEEIYLRAGKIIEDMIESIIAARPSAAPQKGTPVIFTRRRPSQSEIIDIPDLEKLFDHIRMLDADGYPHAFLGVAGFRFEFRRPVLRHGRIVADVVITESGDEE